MANSRDFLLKPSAAPTVVDAGLLILRVGLGLTLAFAHGWGKIPPADGFVGMVGGLGFPAPTLFAWLAGLAEFAGGLLLAIGLLTRSAAIFVTAHFLFVVLHAHACVIFGQSALSRVCYRFALCGCDASVRGLCPLPRLLQDDPSSRRHHSLFNDPQRYIEERPTGLRLPDSFTAASAEPIDLRFVAGAAVPFCP